METMARMVQVVSRHSQAVGNAPYGEVAQEWIDAGFSAEGADRWISAGCFEARSAAALRDAGVKAEQAAAQYESGMTIGYAVANGDISVGEAVERLGVARAERTALNKHRRAVRSARGE